MFGKAYSMCILAIAICLVMSTEADLAKALYQFLLGFQFNDNAGVPITYRITAVKLQYDHNDSEVSSQGENASIEIKKVIIQFLEGHSTDDHRQYDLPQGSEFEVLAKGTGYLSLDGKRVLNCKFTYSEKDDAPIAGIAEPVKQGILSRLSKFDRSLCQLIKVQH